MQPHFLAMSKTLSQNKKIMLQISENLIHFQNWENFLQKNRGYSHFVFFLVAKLQKFAKEKIISYNICSMAHATLMEDEKYFNIGLF